MLISDKIDFKTKTITREKEGHYIMINGLIQEEDITIVNIYAPNIGAPKYIDCVNGHKNKTCIYMLSTRDPRLLYIYAVYKRPTSDLGSHTD